jgi:hypothetical protein
MKSAWKWGGMAILQAGLVMCLTASVSAGDRTKYGSGDQEDNVPRALQPVLDDGYTADQDPAPPVPPDLKASPAPAAEKVPAGKAKGGDVMVDASCGACGGCGECGDCCASRCGRTKWFEDDCDAECAPYFTATGGAMVLHRSKSRNYLIGDGPFTSGELEPEWGAGPRIEIARHYQKWDLEFVYWSVESWNDELDARIQLLPPVHELASYSTRLYNWEWNLKRKFESVTFLAGMRYMELQEKLYDEEAGLLLTSFEQRKTGNYLYGGQFGAQVDIARCSRFSLDAFSKFGVFGNHVHESQQIGNNLIVLGRDATRNETAFLAELGVNARAKLTERLTAYGGYEVMWIDGVVLAPDTEANILLAQSRTNTPFYHGANFGLELRW